MLPLVCYNVAVNKRKGQAMHEGWYSYEETVEEWEDYLEDAQDATTLLLEITPLNSFRVAFEEVAEHAYCANADLYLFDLIRDVWDIAYSHGKHDGMAEEGATLMDIVESGE